MNNVLKLLLLRFSDDNYEMFYSQSANCWLYRNKDGIIREPYPFEEGFKLNNLIGLEFNNEDECNCF